MNRHADGTQKSKSFPTWSLWIRHSFPFFGVFGLSRSEMWRLVAVIGSIWLVSFHVHPLVIGELEGQEMQQIMHSHWLGHQIESVFVMSHVCLMDFGNMKWNCAKEQNHLKLYRQVFYWQTQLIGSAHASWTGTCVQQVKFSEKWCSQLSESGMTRTTSFERREMDNSVRTPWLFRFLSSWHITH